MDETTTLSTTDLRTPGAREVAREISDVGLDHLVDRLSGRGGGLRSSKPTAAADGDLEAYAWRMARFHGGYDASLPVTAAWDLQAFVDDLGVDASVSGVKDETGEEILDVLEAVVDAVLVALEEDHTAGARRWNATGLFGGNQ